MEIVKNQAMDLGKERESPRARHHLIVWIQNLLIPQPLGPRIPP